MGKRIAILGGGPAGVVIASELATAHQFKIDLIEKEDRLGGLHRSVAVGGLVYDIGSFAFETEHEFLRTFPRLYDLCIPVTYRRRSLTPAHRIDVYPLSLRGYLRDHGLGGLVTAACQLLTAKARYCRLDSVSAFARYYLGDAMYLRSGLKSYIERFYGLPDDEIDFEFARQRLSVLQESCSLRRVAWDLLIRLAGQRSRRYDWRSWSAWVRPPGGFDVAYAAIREQLNDERVSVLTGITIHSIARKGSRFVIEFDDRAVTYDRVVSTIPLASAFEYVGQPLAPSDRPEYRRLASLFYRFRGDLGHDSAVLYNFTTTGRWKRLTTFSNIYGSSGGNHYFVVECTVAEVRDETLAELASDFERHVAELSLFRGELDFQGGVITDHAYPVFRRGLYAKVAEARKRLNAWGIDTVGRQGRFEYTSSSVTAERARSFARQLVRSGES
jgi:protoporphyrinogen oxidase